jgi:hypothetical protein
MRYLFKLVKRLSKNDAGRRALIPLVLLGVSACTDTGAPVGDVVTLRVLPQAPQVAMGDSLDFVAVGLTAAGDTVALEVTWSAAQGEIKGKGKGKGLYKPRGSGKDKVKATADSLADSTTVTVVPAAPVITSPSDGATLTTATPMIAGTADGSASVEVFVDAGRVGTVSANGGGNWAYTLTAAQALADGGHATSAIAVDGDGNRSSASATVNFATTVLDTVGFVTGLAPAQYEVARLGVGDQYYVDRDYTITELGPGLSDRLWIRTANGDKGSTTDSAIGFTLLEEAAVVVGYDRSAASVPAWLAGWQEAPAGVRIVVPAPISPLRLFHKTFAPGPVVLGGNLAAGAQGAESMYVVLLLQTSELAPVALQLAPTGATLDPGQSVQFSASVIDLLGRPASSGTIQWTATGGTITTQGRYTAGQDPGSYRVIAHAPEYGLADTAAVSITGLAPMALQIAPTSATLAPGQSVQFSASVLDSLGQPTGGSTIQWSATGGSVTAQGQYTAGQAPGSYRVIARRGPAGQHLGPGGHCPRQRHVHREPVRARGGRDVHPQRQRDDPHPAGVLRGQCHLEVRIHAHVVGHLELCHVVSRCGSGWPHGHGDRHDLQQQGPAAWRDDTCPQMAVCRWLLSGRAGDPADRVLLRVGKPGSVRGGRRLHGGQPHPHDGHAAPGRVLVHHDDV